MMAKDDYHVIAAKILVYLYKKYKQKEVDPNYILPLTKDFPIQEQQLIETISMLIDMELIKGKCVKAWGGDIVMINYESLKITPIGIEYLQENSKIKKVCETLIEAKTIWELFI